MLPVNSLADAGFHVAHLHTVSSHHAYHSNRISCVNNVTQNCNRHGNTFFALAIDVDVGGAVIHSNYLIVNRVDTDKLSAGVTAFRKQRLVYLLADDTYLPVLLYIHIVEVTSIFQHWGFHILVVNICSQHITVDRISFVNSYCAPLRQLRSDDGQFGKQMFQPFYVFELQLPVTSFLETLVRLTCLACSHNDGIGGETREILGQQGFQSVSASDEEQQHEQAPEDAEAGEETSPLVPHQRVRDFFVTVEV